MQRPFFTGLKSLERFRSSNEYPHGASRTISGPSRSSDSMSYGSFTTLKLTAEKLIKEQASVKADLEMARLKLAKSEDQIHTLEAKLQEASNENAKLKVKQKEDTKLWKGLDSKLSSTKTLCDQLTETLQYLSGQVREAEEDKKFFEGKLSVSSKVFDELHLQMNTLSGKLDSAEEKIRSGKQELMVHRQEKEEMEKKFEVERCVTDNLIKEKDVVIKQLEAAVGEEKMSAQNLNLQLEEVHHELSSKDNICKSLKATLDNMEKEKMALQLSNEELGQKLLISRCDMKILEDSLSALASRLTEFDTYSCNVLNSVGQMSSDFDTFYKLVQQEKDLAAKCANHKFDLLHDQFMHVTSEKDGFHAENEELKIKVTKLHEIQEFAMVKHSEECRLAEENVRKLECEREELMSKKTDMETVISKLEAEIKHLSEISSLNDNQMQDLLVKISRLESNEQDLHDKVQSTIEEQTKERETFQKEIASRDQTVELLQNQVSQLRGSVDEKEQLLLELKDREKQLENQNTEIQASLAASEFTLSEARKQYNLALEGKQLELTKHLNEISQWNDQAMNDIRKKYEVEKLEIVKVEKERANKLVGEMEKKCEERISINKEETQHCLQRVQEEHDALINLLRQEHGKKESSLRAHHKEELQRVKHQAESELREKTKLLTKKHEAEMEDVTHQHDDECKKLHEEMELQKSKEEKQRALLQLQWKVMGGNQHEDDEVDSKKGYSVTSVKMRDVGDAKIDQRALGRQGKERKAEVCQGIMQTPMASVLKKVEKGNTGSIISIPKHSRKVTHHEYEVETTNGRTIKRRKTKSTVMFGDHHAGHRRMNTRTPKANKDAVQTQKVIKGSQGRSNIGDLFSEGSLNPYVDDPYAFD